jgi:hypothetical protein
MIDGLKSVAVIPSRVDRLKACDSISIMRACTVMLRLKIEMEISAHHTHRSGDYPIRPSA